MKAKIPKYQKHKGTGQAKVRLNGRDFYLGPYGSDESRQRYDDLIEKWIANGRTIDGGGTSDEPSDSSPADPFAGEITVVELCVKYLDHCKAYYGNMDGRAVGSVDNAKQMIKRIKEVGGTLPVSKFGPKKLKAFQALCIRQKLCRKYINKLSDVLRAMFKWGVSEQCVSVATWQALTALPNIRKGKTAARESKPVQPVADDVVDATLPHLPPVPRDMVRVQRLCGCRPGEVCSMRPVDIDRSGDVWFFEPAEHKNSHRDLPRVIAIGPRGQAVLTPYLDRDPESFCFSPKESEALRWLDLRRDRKSKVQPSQKSRKRKKPQHQPGERYTTQAYSYAVRRASIAAKGEIWTPNRLRHAASTEIEDQYTLEDAQAVLGHTKPDMTRNYSKAQQRKAARIMKEIG